MAVALIRMRRFYALAALCALFAGCSSGDITSPDQIVFPASNVSYSQQVAPYLTLACNSCHDGSSKGNGIDLTSWPQVVVQVRDRDTVLSPLVSVMYGKEQHPPFSANDNQRNGIKIWVLEGAKNN